MFENPCRNRAIWLLALFVAPFAAVVKLTHLLFWNVFLKYFSAIFFLKKEIDAECNYFGLTAGGDPEKWTKKMNTQKPDQRKPTRLRKSGMLGVFLQLLRCPLGLKL